MPRKPRAAVEKLKGAFVTKTVMQLIGVPNAHQLALKLNIEDRSVQRYLTGEREPKQLFNALKQFKYIDIYAEAIETQKHGPYGLPLWSLMESGGGQASYNQIRAFYQRMESESQLLWFDLIMMIKISVQTNELSFNYGYTMHSCAVILVLNILSLLKNIQCEINDKLHSLFISTLFDDALNPYEPLRCDYDPLFLSDDKDEQEWIQSEMSSDQPIIDKNKMLIDLWTDTAPFSLGLFVKQVGWFEFYDDPFGSSEKPVQYEAYFKHAPERVKKFWKGSFKD